MLKSVMRHSSGSGGGGGSLPTTTSGSGSGSGGGGGTMRRLWNKIPLFRNKNDGSAASIRLQTPVVQQWKRSTTSMKASYIVLLVCLIMIMTGWRVLTWHASHVHVNCSSTECYFKLRTMGHKTTQFTTSRSQLVAAKAVKTARDGQRVVQEDVNLNEEWKTFDKGRGKHQKNINTYKGPDKNGHYLSYALYIRNSQPATPSKFINIPPVQVQQQQQQQQQLEEEIGETETGEIVPERHLSQTLLTSGFVEQSATVPSNNIDNNNSDNNNIINFNNNKLVPEYRITMRTYGIVQTRRRIRNQIQKVDSYIKRRRQKLSFKENAAPDWRGILLMVFGFIGFLLAILLGVFWDEEQYEYKNSNGSNKGHSYANSNKGHWGSGGGGGGTRTRTTTSTTTSGPGARKKWPPAQALRPSEVYGGGGGGGDHKKKHNTADADPYSRATPAQYEVSMQPTSSLQTTRSRSIKKSNSSTPTNVNNGGTTTTAAAVGTTTSSSSTTSNTLTTRRRK